MRGWRIPLTVGGEAVTIVGEQVWPPPPVSGPWWLASALAGVTVVVMAAHMAHVLGASLVPDGQPSYLLVVLGTAGIGLGAWLFGAVGAALTLAGRQFGLLLCPLAGAVLAMLTGFDTASFSNAVLPFAWSPDLDRATVALTFGGGLGLFLTGFAVLRTLTPPIEPTEMDAVGMTTPAMDPAERAR